MAFAMVEHLEARLGRSLTETENEAATFALEGAQAAIEVAVDKSEAEIEDLVGSVPTLLKHLCVAVAMRQMANPQGLASESETLGAHSQSRTYNRDTGGDTLLTMQERLAARRAMYGTNTGSVGAEATLLKEYLDEYGS